MDIRIEYLSNEELENQNGELENRNKEKEKSRKTRKANKKSKEKLIISGQGHALIKRLEKEEFNTKVAYQPPKYVKYTRKEKYILLDKCTEDQLDFYLQNPNKYRLQQSSYYEMVSDSFEFERLNYIYLKDLVSEITFFDINDKEIISLDTKKNLDIKNGKYEFSHKWEKIFVDITGMNLRDAIESLNKGHKNIRYANEPRNQKYRKKLKEYKKLGNSSKILKKKITKTKRRKKTRNILNRAKSFDFNSEEFENITSNLPTKDETEYLC